MRKVGTDGQHVIPAYALALDNGNEGWHPALAMGEMKKITVEVPVDTLEAAMREDGNLAETVREALRELAHRRASQRLLALRGKVKFGMTWQELRGKDED